MPYLLAIELGWWGVPVTKLGGVCSFNIKCAYLPSASLLAEVGLKRLHTDRRRHVERVALETPTYTNFAPHSPPHAALNPTRARARVQTHALARRRGRARAAAALARARRGLAFGQVNVKHIRDDALPKESLQALRTRPLGVPACAFWRACGANVQYHVDANGKLCLRVIAKNGLRPRQELLAWYHVWNKDMFSV